MAIRFDPRPAVRKLRDTGMSDDTAEAVVDTSLDVAEAATDDLATKTDLKTEVAELKSDNVKLNARLDVQEARNDARLNRAIVIILGGVAGILALFEYVVFD